MTINFEDLFDDHILQRGYMYYVDGRVLELAADAAQITASVVGTEIYQVRISLEAGRIAKLHCDCPYAAEGAHCKHMAAVLYAVKQPDAERQPSKQEEAAALLDRLSQHALAAFLKEELKTNPDLLFRFTMRFQNMMSSSKDFFRKQIDRVFEAHLGHDGFIGYDEAFDFSHDVSELVHSLHDLVQGHEIAAVLDLVGHILENLDDLPIDDSMGTMTGILEDIGQLLDAMVKETSGEEYDRVFKWLQRFVFDDWFGHDLVEELELVFFSCFNEEDKLREKLVSVDETLRAFGNRSDSVRFGEYFLNTWLQRKVSLLEELGEMQQAESVLREHAHLWQVRLRLVECLLKRGDVVEAIALLEEGKQLHKGSPGAVSEYQVRLAEVYRKQGNVKALREEVRERLLSDRRFSLETYREYRELFAEDEWPCERDQLIGGLAAAGVEVVPVYVEEGMLEELLGTVIRSRDYRALDTYKERCSILLGRIRCVRCCRNVWNLWRCAHRTARRTGP